jgi:beta-lactamase regulating signal transducer with metallopeptidase domain
VTLLMTAARITVVRAVALAMLPLLRRQSAALRAWVLTAALAATALLPFLQVIAPAWGASWVTSETVIAVPGWTRLLVIVWAAGVFVHLFVLAAGIVRLMGIAAAADPIREERCADLALDIAAEYRVHAPVLLLEADRATLPVTWGHSQPKILLPPAARDWSEERTRVVLCHEMAHVRRRDWLVQVGAAIVRSVYWPHPLVWLACSRLKLECERACDDAVLRSGVEGPRYASHLLDLARAFVDRGQPHTAPALIGRSTLECRVRSMLVSRRNRLPVRSRMAVALGVAMLVFAGSIAGFGTPAKPAPTPISLPVKRLTLLLDGRIVDLSKEWPTYPNPRAGLVVGPGFPGEY